MTGEFVSTAFQFPCDQKDRQFKREQDGFRADFWESVFTSNDHKVHISKLSKELGLCSTAVLKMRGS